MFGDIKYDGLGEADVIAYVRLSKKHMARVIVRENIPSLDLRKVTLALNGRVVYHMQGVRLTGERFKTLLDVSNEVDRNFADMTSGESVEWETHLGGLVFVSVSSDYGLVGIRSKFSPSNSNKLLYTQRGVSLKANEFKFLQRLLRKIPDIVPAITHIDSCVSNGHGNQEAAASCNECSMGTITVG